MSKPVKLEVVGTVLEVFRSRGIGPAVEPALDCTEGLVKYIDAAQHSIYFAIYSLGSPAIADALVAAKQRGLDMYGIGDNTQWAGRSALDQQLIDAGIDIERAVHQHACMHLKTAVIDGHIVTTGSFNWTDRAENKNDEMMVVMDSDDVADVIKTQIDEARELNR